MAGYIIGISTSDAAGKFTLTARFPWQNDPLKAKPLDRPAPVPAFRYATLSLRSGAFSAFLSEYQRRYVRHSHGQNQAAFGFPQLAHKFPERVPIIIRYSQNIDELQGLPQSDWPIASIELGWKDVGADAALPVASFRWWDGERIQTLTLSHLEITEVGRDLPTKREIAMANLQKAREARELTS